MSILLPHEHGPFDLIGDVHGCLDELVALLGKLGWVDGRHPQARKAVFLGDLVDRGPHVAGVLRLAMQLVASGNALCVLGNHEAKLLRALDGRQVTVASGLRVSLDQLAEEPPAFLAGVRAFLSTLHPHVVLDDGRLVAAHAGLEERLHGIDSPKARAFALFGDTTGRTDANGYPERRDWAATYGGRATVVYGHTPIDTPAWKNGAICIDTGCVFGGALTALRYPERELVSVPAARAHWAH